MNKVDVDRVIERRLREAAEEYFVHVLESLPGLAGQDDRAAFRVLLAFLATGNDGYNSINPHQGNWGSRPRLDFGTVMSCHVPVGQLTADFFFEVQYGESDRTLAVLIDTDSPNERTVSKQRVDAALLGLNARVMRFTPAEVERDPEACTDAISSRLSDLAEEMLAEAGVIRGSVSSKD